MSTLPAVNAAQLGSALAAANQQGSLNEDGMLFMKMNKSGEWLYGTEEIEAQTGSVWAVNPNSFMEGFIAWGEGEVLGEEMAPMVGTPILVNNLPTTAAKRGWEKQIGFQLACLNGEDEGTQVIFKASSKGGIKAARKLISEVVAQIAADPTSIVPEVSLDTDSYKHKQYGKIYTPVFSVVGWVSMDAATAPEPAAAPAPAAAAAPAPETAPAAAAPAAEAPAAPAAEAPAPRRRRPVAS